MIGSQEPRIKIEPRRKSSDGPDAAELMAAYCCDLDEWQKTVLDCWLGKNAKGKYTMTSGGISVPRQNGKNVIIEARELFGAAILGEKILHTAHQVKTSKKSFRRLAAIFTDKRFPEMQDAVKTIRYTNGEECIELVNGGSIEYSARSRQAARGFDGISVVIYDEAQELTDDQVEAITATLSASATGTRQIIYAGTPPYPNCPGEVFRRRRQVCLQAPGPHDAWHEWSIKAETASEIRTDERSIWYMTNPALGTRLTEEFTEEEMRAMSRDGFARERLGWWSPVLERKADLAIPEKAWEDCKSTEMKPEGKTAYGVKFTADASEVVLCGAVIPESGPARVSIIDRQPTGRGTQWLADWLNKRYAKAACVVIDGRNGADVLVDKISETWKAKGSVVRPTGRGIVAAAGMLCDMVSERTVTWFAGQEDLRESAVNSTKRPISGGWGFGGENSAPIEAAALALWGAKTAKRDPNRRMKVG